MICYNPISLCAGVTAMSLWRDLLHRFGYTPQAQPSFRLNLDLADSIRDLAEEQGRTEAELAAELLNEALARRQVAEEQLRRWWGLSPRQREVAALICSHYTNAQIANSLEISPLTVKTHVRNLLWKLDVRDRNELIALLADWDFSAYIDPGKDSTA